MLATRRAFLGVGRFRKEAVIRPPWALEEHAFQEKCTRCSACVDVCPTSLLVKGGGGYPEADFTPGRASAGCTFCGECAQVCPSSALLRKVGIAPWSLQIAFNSDCLAARDVVCRTCGESCEQGAIRFPPRVGGVARPQLDSRACTGCGACLADCPTAAIRVVPAVSDSSSLRGVA